MARQSYGDFYDYGDDAWDWQESDAWSEHRHAASISRPTEDRAFRNIDIQTRALRHYRRHALELDLFQRMALNLERRCKRDNPHIRGWAVYEWVAPQMRGFDGEWTARRVQGVLEDADEILRALEFDHMVDVMVAWEKRKRDRAERDRMIRRLFAAHVSASWRVPKRVIAFPVPAVAVTLPAAA